MVLIIDLNNARRYFNNFKVSSLYFSSLNLDGFYLDLVDDDEQEFDLKRRYSKLCYDLSLSSLV
jgi:hypothetical protein